MSLKTKGFSHKTEPSFGLEVERCIQNFWLEQNQDPKCIQFV